MKNEEEKKEYRHVTQNVNEKKGEKQDDKACIHVVIFHVATYARITFIQI